MKRKQCGCGRAQAVRPGGLCNKCFAAQAAAGKEHTVTETIIALPLDSLLACDDTQPRESLDDQAVAEYAEEYGTPDAPGKDLPPVDAVFDGAKYWLWDGFHRYHARRRAGWEDIKVRVAEGTKADAQWLATGANKSHGLRRTNKDKIRAVHLSLCLHPERTDGWLATHVGVHPQTVTVQRLALVARGAIPWVADRCAEDGRRYNVPPPASHYHSDSLEVANTPGADTPRPTNPAAANRHKHICEECAEAFDIPVWHCTRCDHHWPMSREECWNCHETKRNDCPATSEHLPDDGDRNDTDTEVPPRCPAPETGDHTCDLCGKPFGQPMWHCTRCHQHWPADRETCGNCPSSRRNSNPQTTAADVEEEGRQGGDEEEGPADESPERSSAPPAGAVVEPALPAGAVVDVFGHPVPERLHESFRANERYRVILQHLKEIKREANKLASVPGGELLRRNLQNLFADLDNARRIVRFRCMPFSVCPYCLAKRDNCEACKGLGWSNESIFESAPDAMRRKANPSNALPRLDD